MSGDEVQAPWAGLTWESYCAEVRALSAYPINRDHLCSLSGALAEMGELLALFDLRRVDRKGEPARETVRAELGDVLWYSALGLEVRISAGWWQDTRDRRWLDCEQSSWALIQAIGDVAYYGSALGPAVDLCWGFGFSAQEVAFYNLEKLRARQSAGTLHDREARGAAGGGV